MLLLVKRNDTTDTPQGESMGSKDFFSVAEMDFQWISKYFPKGRYL